MSFRSPMELLAIGNRNCNNFHNFSRQIEVVKKHKNRCNFASFEGNIDLLNGKKYGAIRNVVHHPAYHSQYYVMKMNVF